MIWIIVFAAIGVAGLLMLAAYAIWLAHKTSDLYAELKVLSDRGGQLAQVASQIQVPERGTDPTLARTRPAAEKDPTVTGAASPGAASPGAASPGAPLSDRDV